MPPAQEIRDGQKYKKILTGVVGAGILIGETILVINILAWITGGAWTESNS
jgi:hypothetical protein